MGVVKEGHLTPSPQQSLNDVTGEGMEKVGGGDGEESAEDR